MAKSLKLMLEETARRYGKKIAIVSGEHRLSYASLDAASNKVANALIKIGIEKGDRAAMLLSNSPEFAITYFGIIKTGAIAVPLATYNKIAELTSLFDNCRPKVLVSESSLLEPLIPSLPQFKSIKHVIDLGSQYKGRFLSYNDILATNSSTKTEIEPEPEDVAHITYPSGPSFPARGAMLSHRSLIAEAAISARAFQQTEPDIITLFSLPMYHMFGLLSVLLATLYTGGTIIMVPGTAISIDSLLAAIERERSTIFLGVPYIFALLVDKAEKEGIKNDLSSVRVWCSAGAPLLVNTVRRFKQCCGGDIVDVWGLSESVCMVTGPDLDGTQKLGSVGKALPGWEVKVVDDDGRELPPSQAGELIVRGPIMKGYYNNPQATAEAMKDGWLYSGDIGQCDEEGNLFITGRKKDMIILKGQNIYPSDVESVLLSHPEVAEAAVIGIPDALRGEIVAAVIVPKKGQTIDEQDVRRFCLERIASYKAPRQVFLVSSLPRTDAGKIDKPRVRKDLSIPPVFAERILS